MALRDLFRGGRRHRDEHTRYPLDPLSRESWHEEADARYGSDVYRDFDDERRHVEYGGSSNNPFYGDHPLARAGSTYDSDYFGSKFGLPTTPWRSEADSEQFDELVYGGRPRGEFSGMGPRGYSRSDERIKEDVCQCLTDDDHIDASDIEVMVKDREVILTGTVRSRMQKRHAEDLIERLSGVRDVINSLRVVDDTRNL
ncbi:BON domain-containing protein [Steroidobacter flavus]|uniref:BON domain-containing protein n=1 Tax=Steroidobacter flavus TaxID=1842136 RepID=A0ABV8SJY1_9GAMM